MNKILKIFLIMLFLITICTSCDKNSYPQEKENSSDEEKVIHSETYKKEEKTTSKKSNTVENFKTDNVDNNTVEKSSIIDTNPQENNNTANNKQEADLDELSDKDKTIISEFNSLKNKTAEILNSDEISAAKDASKGVFISIVDFLFYDGEIKEIKFSELTSDGKKQVLLIASKIESLITTKFPDYKTDISEITAKSYNKASELIKKGSQNITEISKEKLGEDNYNAIINAKDELVDYTKKMAGIVGDFSSTTINDIKNKIKNWYEEFRNN